MCRRDEVKSNDNRPTPDSTFVVSQVCLLPTFIKEHIMPRLALLVVLLSTIGCASGPKGNAVAIPAVEASKSRIVIYRMPNPIASLDQPNILMDGVVVGKSETGCFTYADVTPGTHLVECTGGAVNRISVQTTPGMTAYVETTVNATIDNFQFTLAQKPEAEGKSKTAGLTFRAPAQMPPAVPAAKP